MESFNRWKTTGFDDAPLALAADARRFKSPSPGRPSLASRIKSHPTKKQNPSSKKKSEEHIKCYRCNEYDHFAKQCNNPRNNDPALKSLPGRRDEHRSDESRFDIVAMMPFATDLPNGNTSLHAVNKPLSDFLLDSGSSVHIVNDARLLVNIEQMNAPMTIYGLSSTVTVARKGQMVVDFTDYRIVFMDVLLCPESIYNILSTGCLIDRGWRVEQTTSGGAVTKSGTTIPIARKNALYVVQLDLCRYEPTPADRTANVQTAMAVTRSRAARFESSREWRERLGHIGVSTY